MSDKVQKISLADSVALQVEERLALQEIAAHKKKMTLGVAAFIIGMIIRAMGEKRRRRADLMSTIGGYLMIAGISIVATSLAQSSASAEEVEEEMEP